MQLHYRVDYIEDGFERTQKDIWCSNPGAAFAACQKIHPEAKMLKAWVEGAIEIQGSNCGYQEWEAPPVQRQPVKEQRPSRALKPDEKGCEFPFYDEVKVKPVPETWHTPAQ